MNDKLKNAFIGLIVVVVIVGAGVLGMVVGGFFKKSDEVVSVANGIVTDKDVSMKEASVLTTYEEYTKLLEEYDSSDVVLLTNNDFNNNDYIVDYIYYDKDVLISSISELTVYIVNSKVEEKSNNSTDDNKDNDLKSDEDIIKDMLN